MRRSLIIWLVAFVAIGLLVFWLAASAAFLQHWMAIHSGADYLMCKDSPCPNQIYYNWWSGPGSDLGELTLITAVLASAFTVYRSRECHTPTCHWPAHHTTANGYRLCKKCIGKPEAELDLHPIDESHQ